METCIKCGLFEDNNPNSGNLLSTSSGSKGGAESRSCRPSNRYKKRTKDSAANVNQHDIEKKKQGKTRQTSKCSKRQKGTEQNSVEGQKKTRQRAYWKRSEINLQMQGYMQNHKKEEDRRGCKLNNANSTRELRDTKRDTKTKKTM